MIPDLLETVKYSTLCNKKKKKVLKYSCTLVITTFVWQQQALLVTKIVIEKDRFPANRSS